MAKNNGQERLSNGRFGKKILEQPPKPPINTVDTIPKDPKSFPNAVALAEYMLDRDIPPVVVNSIVNEYNLSKRGTVSVDKEKEILLQILVILDFITLEGLYPKLYSYIEREMPRYLPLLDDTRLPFLHGRSPKIHEVESIPPDKDQSTIS